jgi:hypothetical protein
VMVAGAATAAAEAPCRRRDRWSRAESRPPATTTIGARATSLVHLSFRLDPSAGRRAPPRGGSCTPAAGSAAVGVTPGGVTIGIRAGSASFP